MKIAIITTSYANNYGAQLQTYALQRYLNENMGHDAITLDYRPPWCKNPWQTLPHPKNFKVLLMNVYTVVKFKNYIRTKKRAQANRLFSKKHIKLSNVYTSAKELQNCKDEYDCLICGSDQIWNVDLRENKMPHPEFFLQFAKDWENVRKVAYAPSVTDTIPEGSKEILKQYLEIFDALSIRELSDVEPVQKLTDKKVHQVVDPVFLLSPEQWSNIATQPKVEGKYILCYFLSYGNSYEHVKKIREMTGYKVVNLNINRNDGLDSDEIIWDAGADDFIGLIKNAEFICTNSFHCTAFSIIFRKNFIVVPKRKSNSRMETLQTIFGIDDRFVSEEWLETLTPEKLCVDYSIIDTKFQNKIEESVKYLKDALYEN